MVGDFFIGIVSLHKGRFILGKIAYPNYYPRTFPKALLEKTLSVRLRGIA